VPSWLTVKSVFSYVRQRMGRKLNVQRRGVEERTSADEWDTIISYDSKSLRLIAGVRFRVTVVKSNKDYA
jgi:hypothetical protein